MSKSELHRQSILKHDGNWRKAYFELAEENARLENKMRNLETVKEKCKILLSVKMYDVNKHNNSKGTWTTINLRTNELLEVLTLMNS